MDSIDNFLSEVYSEELYSFTEAEYAEVMSASPVAADFEGYSEWSDEIEKPEGDLENFEVRAGMLHYKGAGLQRRPAVNGIEV